MGSDGTVFIVDTIYDRVLIYPPFDLSNLPQDPAAIDLIGQPAFNVSIPGLTSLSSLNAPLGATYDSKYNCLWVADGNNARVLRFPNILLLQPVNPSPSQQISFPSRSPDVIITPPASGTQITKKIISKYTNLTFSFFYVVRKFEFFI